MKLTIDRKRWGRGQGAGFLLDNDKMCCLGFLGKACGLSDTAIEDLGSPSDVDSEAPTKHKRLWASMGTSLKKVRKVLEESVSTVEAVFVVINDAENITDRKRESLLTKEFAKIGVEVEFTGAQA